MTTRGDSTLEVRSPLQGRGDGSIPISPLQLKLQLINHASAKYIYAKYHYLGNAGLMSSHNWGVFFDGECLGAISYGVPNAKNCFPHYTQETQCKWLELKRLALSDILPKNSESRVIAVSIRLLHAQRPNIFGIVTYADTAQNHTGAIYRASGFTYCGLTAPKTDLYINGKKFGKQRGAKYSELGGEWRRRSQKHLFVKIISP